MFLIQVKRRKNVELNIYLLYLHDACMKRIIVYHIDPVVSGKILDAVSACSGFSAVFLNDTASFLANIQHVKPDLLITSTDDYQRLMADDVLRTKLLSGKYKIVLLANSPNISLIELPEFVSIVPEGFNPQSLKIFLKDMVSDCARQIQSRDHLDWVVQHIPTAIFWKDLHLKYLGCNQLFAADRGLSNTDWNNNFDFHAIEPGTAKTKHTNECICSNSGC